MTFDGLPKRLTPAEALRRVRKLWGAWPARPELPVASVLGVTQPEDLESLRRFLKQVVLADTPPTELPPDLADDPVVVEMWPDAEAFRTFYRSILEADPAWLPPAIRELRAELTALGHPWETGAKA